ncbi:MAG: BrnT family toxin [Patescibacteria group bacterium]
MFNFKTLTGFDWDEGNTRKNWLKHKVSTQESEEVFSSRPLIILPDVPHSNQAEKRFHAFGKSSAGRLLLISLTIRNNKIRVVSARPMNLKERIFYESYQQKN